MNTPDSRHDFAERATPYGSSPEALGRRDVARPAQDAALSTVPAERRILALLGEVRRVGRWTVPRLFRVRALMGEVKVDLRESAIPEGFTFDVMALGARVTLIVPPDVSVMFDVFAVMGNAISQAHEPTAGDTARRAIRVAGSAIAGEVRVLVRERGA
jgi:hypothetical protein